MNQSRIVNGDRSRIPNFVKKTLSLTLQKKIIPPERFWDLLSFEGNFSVDLGNKQFQVSHTGEWLENSLFWKGLAGYEPISFELWKNACQFSQTILDIGANTGLYSLIAKTVNPSSNVYAFEPLPSFNQALKENIRLNHYDIQVIDQAVANFMGTAEFYAPQRGQGNLYSSSLSLEHYKNHQKSTPIVHQVQVTTLDTFVQKQGIRSVDLVKIDAEGQDANVLKGFLNSMQQFQPDFIVEVQSDEIGQEIQAMLPPEKYLYFNVDEVTGLKQTDSLRRNYWLNFWICKVENCAKSFI
ncbi:MAG: FkbM family methyltransferase [Leptolyngbyaceae cyanobacterium CSU_1_4]|nr:FkbM family methyltransferase [Leptolyngbyaceae cyanobacterium CSU_1_4]